MGTMERKKMMMRREDDGPTQLVRKYVKNGPGPNSMLSMRGNTDDLAGTEETRRHQGGPGVGGAGTREEGGPGRGGDDETTILLSDTLPAKPNDVTGVDQASKDVCVKTKLDVVRVMRGETDVVRRVVNPDSRGTYRDRQRDDTEGVCVVFHEGDRPGGGEERSFETALHKTKPNQVKGGLMARIQFWEVQTNKIQSGIQSEAFTNDDLRLEFRDRDRKQI